MKASAKTFYSIGVCLFIALVLYAMGTAYMDNDASRGGGESVSIVVIVMAVSLSIMLCNYFHIIDLREVRLLEDCVKIEVEDASGIYGFFSPVSIWPFVMSMSIAVLGYGLAFYFLWMIVLGLVLLAWSATMLSLQYGMPKEKH